MTMKPVIIGAVVALAVVGAFAFGVTMEEQSQGPAEAAGEALDNTIDDIESNVDRATD